MGRSAMMYPTDEQTPRPPSNLPPRRKGPPAALRIDTPAQNPAITLVVGDSSASVSASASASASTLSSAASDSDCPLPFAQSRKSKPMRNTKRLSLTLPASSTNVSTNSLTLPSDCESQGHTSDNTEPSSFVGARRRSSIVSLPNPPVASRLLRKDEDGSPSAPYIDGPVQVLPGVWLGSEDNARDWSGLVERGIRSILNVAREVSSPFDTAASSQPLRSFASTPDLKEKFKETEGAFYPAHGPTGRPSMHYLKLPWSHGQSDLVQEGFKSAMAFIDDALERGDGVLIHCQCGVSRSATVVIALVMRAAALQLPSVPPEVWALKSGGMHGAYAFVKEKSKWVGPNMSLIYQLLEYEKALNTGNKSPTGSEHSSVIAEEEEEWTRRRRLLDEEVEGGDDDRESLEVIREARALDKAMEERMVARKASSSSNGSSFSGSNSTAWKGRYGSRKRAGSIASNFTSGSIISENLVEENEEEELLGVGGGFDAPSISTRSPSETTEEEASGSSPDCKRGNTSFTQVCTPSTAKPGGVGKRLWPSSVGAFDRSTHPPPSAPATKTSFTSRLPFKFRSKARPPPLALLPTVPSSPVAPAVDQEEDMTPKAKPRARLESGQRHAPPPLRFVDRPAHTRSSSRSSQLSQLSLNTPSQTLFVFPPSPTLQAQTPHTVTVTSRFNISQPFSVASTPRVSTFVSDGRRRSFIGVPVPSTPTTACSRVDARGWINSKGI